MNVILCPDKKGQSPKAQLSPANVSVLAKRRQIAVGSSFKARFPRLAPLSSLREPGTQPNWPSVSSVQFSYLVVSDSATPWIATCQASLFITNSQSLLRFMSIESVMPSSHLILCCPLLLLLSVFPASGSFPMSQFFVSGGQSTGVSASASVLPTTIQD